MFALFFGLFVPLYVVQLVFILVEIVFGSDGYRIYYKTKTRVLIGLIPGIPYLLLVLFCIKQFILKFMALGNDD